MQAAGCRLRRWLFSSLSCSRLLSAVWFVLLPPLWHCIAESHATKFLSTVLSVYLSYSLSVHLIKLNGTNKRICFIPIIILRFFNLSKFISKFYYIKLNWIRNFNKLFALVCIFIYFNIMKHKLIIIAIFFKWKISYR